MTTDHDMWLEQCWQAACADVTVSPFMPPHTAMIGDKLVTGGPNTHGL